MIPIDDRWARWRVLLSYFVGVVLVLIVSRAADEPAQLPLLVLGVGGLVAHRLVDRLRHSSPTGLRRAVPLFTSDQQRTKVDRPQPLIICESEIVQAASDDGAADRKLRPHLTELTRASLADVGVDLDRSPEAAKSLLGANAYRSLNERGAMAPADVEEILTVLEGLNE